MIQKIRPVPKKTFPKDSLETDAGYYYKHLIEMLLCMQSIESIPSRFSKSYEDLIPLNIRKSERNSSQEYGCRHNNYLQSGSSIYNSIIRKIGLTSCRNQTINAITQERNEVK